jgi:CheY-like chemotaxis protein
MRVLIVDDHLDTLDMFSTLLGLWGHEVRAIQQPALALAEALKFLPDVVFLDLEMPEIDGYEVARAMRGRHRLDGTFLMAVTGHGLEEDRARTHAAGFDGHLLKPVVAQQLKQFLQKRPHPMPRPKQGARTTSPGQS